MKYLITIFIGLIPFWGSGQNCSITLKGQIIDEGSNLSLSYASIRIVELDRGMITDSIGQFQLDGLCSGSYHIEISHIGFEVEKHFLQINRDTTVSLNLHHHDELLNEIVIHSENIESFTQISRAIDSDKIAMASNQTLGELAAHVTGVSVVKNGPGISKPVIHGLFGNRITILNNGAKQAGQRWGNDHAPEIDMLAADHLAIIKGVAGLEISGGSLGGVIQIHSGNINRDPHVHGRVLYNFQSNGLGHTLHSEIKSGNQTQQWRITATGRLIGDARAPDYYLSNTGRRETNFSATWNRTFSKNWRLETYYSLFRTQIGILSGSHIGNTTDLEQALDRPIPFNTRNRFSYRQKAPRQEVDHHLFVLKNQFFISEKSEINFKYSVQVNLRDEFDIRRGGRSETPAVSLALQSHLTEAVYQHEISESLSFKTGVQLTYNANSNDNARTLTTPLIPNYRSYIPGMFLTLRRKLNKSNIELGARYDWVDLRVVNITRQNTLERNNHSFHNYSIAFGMNRDWSEHSSSRFNIGFAQRTPEVNELYSRGIHQGVASFEEGDPNLDIEKSVKAILSNDFFISKKFLLQMTMYSQIFSNYIYLRPEGTILTIRGAFPQFLYDQTDALLYGLDLNLSYEPNHRIKLGLSYAFLEGTDLLEDIPLVFLPSNNLSGRFNYSLDNLGIFRNNSISVQPEYVFERFLEEGQELAPPPPGYFLLNLELNTKTNIGNSNLYVGIKVDNVLNSTYRNYLDRLRFFADSPGINASITLNYKF